MRILVLSDTHLTNSGETLFKELEDEIAKSDCCFHTGDFTVYPAYNQLTKKIKTYAVAGNMDDQQITNKLPKKIIVKLAGFTFALIHGRGISGTIEQYVTSQFQDDFDKINIFVFGHSHQPVNHQLNDKIYFNPGSVGDTITTSKKSYGIIEIEDSRIRRRIQYIG
ncbi:MAG: YfcE family phosphodiesterase [Candidatus Omnitrophica bacterium]|nr:YfcE family phosphodiesterase [Candidatus Omnitrophota bacterium]MCF7877054.1 YfcE family phosphodiesterase [Candidatus Omnitrophota bacterium]MCF7891403.1 YfcE family phosphodiesterase [Candidatus Omnitrophota bacterium]MCF7897927.1 YfcE family phosphodiesterase [Candidatus Omnitrophota bacterium]MCF7909012.1 YfcE family phosphodiesterase [Candidatus Omnitrophota bacterium]